MTQDPAAPPLLHVRGLTKRYGPTLALDGLDLEVRAGEWFLFLGPNGAGKSTTMRLLMGLGEPTAGEMSVVGCDPWRQGPEVRRRVGFLSEDFHPYEFLSGREYLQFVGDMFGLDPAARDRKVEDLLALLDLAGSADRMTREYSHGMRKKLGIAAALLHDPKLLILDEPTAELDPRTSDLIRMVLRGLADAGVAVVMSTHILGTAEKHCDRVGILHQGRLVRCGTTAELLAEYPGHTLEELFLRVTGAADPAVVKSYLERRPS